MMEISRRMFLGSAAVAAAGPLARAASPKIRIGVTDWNLRMGANPDALPLAAKIGFEGVQISFGRKTVDDKLPLDNPQLIDRYLSLARQSKVAIASTCVDKLHDNGLKSDKLAVKWVLDSIRLTKALNARVLLLPFFGKWALQTPAEMDYTGDALREIAPEAGKAGVILALEDTISAEDNVRVMERSRSKNVQVYYDTGNSTNAGFDILKEIRWLGKARICEIHLKDNPNYLGEGKIQFPEVFRAMRDIGYSAWAVLETDTHKGATVEDDMAKNLAFARRGLA
jgi:L-ribulose-5-phosphate 3-epimerase